jgi:hypothetical protein
VEDVFGLWDPVFGVLVLGATSSVLGSYFSFHRNVFVFLKLLAINLQYFTNPLDVNLTIGKRYFECKVLDPSLIQPPTQVQYRVGKTE